MSRVAAEALDPSRSERLEGGHPTLRPRGRSDVPLTLRRPVFHFTGISSDDRLILQHNSDGIRLTDAGVIEQARGAW